MASPAKSKMGLFGMGDSGNERKPRKKRATASGGETASVEKSPPKKRGRPKKSSSNPPASRDETPVPQKTNVSPPNGGLVLGLIDSVLRKGK